MFKYGKSFDLLESTGIFQTFATFTKKDANQKFARGLLKNVFSPTGTKTEFQVFGINRRIVWYK